MTAPVNVRKENAQIQGSFNLEAPVTVEESTIEKDPQGNVTGIISS